MLSMVIRKAQVLVLRFQKSIKTANRINFKLNLTLIRGVLLITNNSKTLIISKIQGDILCQEDFQVLIFNRACKELGELL